ncbi:hypothetical protein BDK51DRAFT_27836, partial [Blyttiomyces helicus]
PTSPAQGWVWCGARRRTLSQPDEIHPDGYVKPQDGNLELVCQDVRVKIDSRFVEHDKNILPRHVPLFALNQEVLRLPKVLRILLCLKDWEGVVEEDAGLADEVLPQDDLIAALEIPDTNLEGASNYSKKPVYAWPNEQGQTRGLMLKPIAANGARVKECLSRDDVDEGLEVEGDRWPQAGCWKRALRRC